MPVFKGTGGRKSTDTDAQRARDMWVAHRTRDSLFLNGEGIPDHIHGDLDALIEWNSSKTNRPDRPERPVNYAPVSQHLTREHIRAWRKSANECRANFKEVLLWPCMYCLHFIDYRERPKIARFFCRRSECIGRGKIQVNCLWNIEEGKKHKFDNRARAISWQDDDRASIASSSSADTVRPQ